MGDQTYRTSGDIQADYRGPWALGAMYVLPIVAVGLAFAIPLLLKSHPNDVRIPGLGYPIIGLCVLAFPCIYLGYRNIRVAIVGDRIISTDILGRVRIDCSIHDVIHGSFKPILGKSGQPDSYVSQTTEGKVMFDAPMRNAGPLANRLKTISDGIAPPAHPATAWTSDPLSEPDPGGMPLK